MATDRPFGLPEPSARLQEYIDRLRNRYEQIGTGPIPDYTPPAPGVTQEEEAGKIENLLSALGSMQESLRSNLVDLPVNLMATQPLREKAARWMQQDPESWYRDESIPPTAAPPTERPVSASELAKDAYVGRPEPGESAGTQHAKALARGVVGRVVDMSADPTNLALMLGGGALAKLPALGTAVNLGFGAAMAKATYDATGEAYDLYRKEGWSPAVSEKAAEAGVDAALLALPIVSGARAIRRARGRGEPGGAGEPPSGDAGTPPPSGRMTPEELARLGRLSREELRALREQVDAELPGAEGSRATELRAIKAQLDALADLDARMIAAEAAGDMQEVAKLAQARTALAEALVRTTRPRAAEPTPAEREGLPPEAQEASDAQLRQLLQELRAAREAGDEFGMADPAEMARLDAVIASIESQLRQPGRSHAHESPAKPPEEGKGGFLLDEDGNLQWVEGEGGRRPYEPPAVRDLGEVQPGFETADDAMAAYLAAMGIEPGVTPGVPGPRPGTRITGEPTPPAEAGVPPTEAAGARAAGTRPEVDDLLARAEAAAAGRPIEPVPGAEVVRGEAPTVPGEPATTPVVPAPGAAGVTTAGRPVRPPAPPTEPVAPTTAYPAPIGPRGPAPAPLGPPAPAPAPPAPAPPAPIPPISPAVRAEPEEEPPARAELPPVRGDVVRNRDGTWRLRLFDRGGQITEAEDFATKKDAKAALQDRQQMLKANRKAERAVKLSEDEYETVINPPGTYDWPTEDSIEITREWYDAGKHGEAPALYRTLMNARQMGVPINDGWKKLFPDLAEAKEAGVRKPVKTAPPARLTDEERAQQGSEERAERLRTLPDAAFDVPYTEDAAGVKTLKPAVKEITKALTTTVAQNVGAGRRDDRWFWRDSVPLEKNASAWLADVEKLLYEGKSPYRAVLQATGGKDTNRFRAAVQPLFGFPLLEEYAPEFQAEEQLRRRAAQFGTTVEQEREIAAKSAAEQEELRKRMLAAMGKEEAPAAPAPAAAPAADLAPVSGRPEPLPDRTRWVGRGVHGQAKVVFPDRRHADLYKLGGKSWTHDDAKRLAGWLKVPVTGDDGIMAIARNYRGDITKLVRDLPKDVADPELQAPRARLTGIKTAIEQAREEAEAAIPGRKTLEEHSGIRAGDEVQVPAPFGRTQDATVQEVFELEDGRVRARVFVPKGDKQHPKGYETNVDIDKIQKGGKYDQELPTAVKRGWRVTDRKWYGKGNVERHFTLVRGTGDNRRALTLSYNRERDYWTLPGVTGTTYKTADAALDAFESVAKKKAKKERTKREKGDIIGENARYPVSKLRARKITPKALAKDRVLKGVSGTGVAHYSDGHFMVRGDIELPDDAYVTTIEPEAIDNVLAATKEESITIEPYAFTPAQKRGEGVPAMPGLVWFRTEGDKLVPVQSRLYAHILSTQGKNLRWEAAPGVGEQVGAAGQITAYRDPDEIPVAVLMPMANTDPPADMELPPDVKVAEIKDDIPEEAPVVEPEEPVEAAPPVEEPAPTREFKVGDQVRWSNGTRQGTILALSDDFERAQVERIVTTYTGTTRRDRSWQNISDLEFAGPAPAPTMSAEALEGAKVVPGPIDGVTKKQHGWVVVDAEGNPLDALPLGSKYKTKWEATEAIKNAKTRTDLPAPMPTRNGTKFASGMSRSKDFLAALKRGKAVGVDIGQLSDRGLEQLARGIAANPKAPVFVDSGAFSLFKANLKRQKLEGNEAVAKALDFDTILQKYNELINAVGETPGAPLLLTMPDVVGDQKATLKALYDNADLIAEVMETGRADFVFPVQTGEMSLRRFAAEIQKFLDNELNYDLGDRQIILGIPANVQAAPREQVFMLAQYLVSEHNGARLHFLGATSAARLDPVLSAAREGAGNELEWSADANQLRSKLKPGVTRPEAMAEVLEEEEPVAPAEDIEPDLKANREAAGPFLEVVESYISELRKADPPAGDAWLLPRFGPKDARFDDTYGTKLGDRGFVPGRVENPAAKDIPGAPKYLDNWMDALDQIRDALNKAGWRADERDREYGALPMDRATFYKDGWHLFIRLQGDKPPIVQFAPDEQRPGVPQEVRGLGDQALSEQQEAALGRWIKKNMAGASEAQVTEAQEATRQHFNANRKLRAAESNKDFTYKLKPGPGQPKSWITQQRKLARAELTNAQVLSRVTKDRLRKAAPKAFKSLLLIAEDRMPRERMPKRDAVIPEVAQLMRGMEQHPQASTIVIETLGPRTLEYAKTAVVEEASVAEDLQRRVERALERKATPKELKETFAKDAEGVGEKGVAAALKKGPDHPAWKRILKYNVEKTKQMRGLEEALLEDGATQGLLMDEKVVAELQTLAEAMARELDELPEEENPLLPWDLTNPETNEPVTARDALAAMQSQQGRLYARIVHKYTDNAAAEEADDVPFDVPGVTDDDDIPKFEAPDKKPPRSVLSMPLGKKAVRQAQLGLDFGPPKTVDRPKVDSQTPGREGTASRPKPGGVPGLAGRPPAGVAGGERPGRDDASGGGGQPAPGQVGGAPQRQARPSKGIFDVITVRSEFTERSPAHLELIPEALLKHLDPHQQIGVGKAIHAMNTDQRGFYLADGTGVGKTREILATAHYWLKQGKKVLVIAPANVLNIPKSGPRKGQITGSFKDDSEAMGIPIVYQRVKRKDVEAPALIPGKVNLGTYEFIDKQPVDEDTVLVLDEAHYVKNATSTRGLAGQEKLDKAHAVLLSTATPGDQAHHLRYLKRIGFLEGKTENEQLRALGMTSFDMPTKGGKVVVWKPRSRKLMKKRLRELMQRLAAGGRTIKREIDFSGVPVNFVELPVPPDVQEELDKVAAAWPAGEDEPPQNRRMRLMHQRRQLEPGKIPYLKRRVQEELAQGRKVIIFAQRVRYSAVVKRSKVWVGGEQVTVEDLITATEGTILQFEEWMEEQGIKFSRIHGEAKNKFDEMEKFQRGETDVVVATVESGGTGINLDDRKGDAPRTMIFLTAPLESNVFVQAAGRSHRLPTRSVSNIEVLIADHEVDNWNKNIIATKIALQGALVSGAVKKLDPELAEQMDEFGTPVVANDPTKSQTQKEEDAKELPSRQSVLGSLRSLSTYQGRTSNPKAIVSLKQYDYLRKKLGELGANVDRYGDFTIDTREFEQAGYQPVRGTLVKPKGTMRSDPGWVNGEMSYEEDLPKFEEPYQPIEAGGVLGQFIRAEGDEVLMESFQGNRLIANSKDVTPVELNQLPEHERQLVLADTRGFFDPKTGNPTATSMEFRERISLIDAEIDKYEAERSAQVWRKSEDVIAGMALAERIAQLERARSELIDHEYRVTPPGPPQGVVYHGTRESGFERFDPERFDKDALYGPGIYVTDNPVLANEYTRGGPGVIGGLVGERAGIYPIRVTVDEDRVLDMDADRAPEHLVARAVRDGFVERRETGLSVDDIYQALISKRGDAGFANEWLRAAGYDVLTYLGGQRMGYAGIDHRAWVILDPKLARGAYTRTRLAAPGRKKVRLLRGVEDLIRDLPKYESFRSWPQRHRDTLDLLFGEDAGLFQELLGATSAANTVAGNVSLALKAYFQLRKGEPFRGYMMGVVENLERIREEEGVRGPKVDPYTRALMGDMSQVWVDRHVARFFFGRKALKDGMTPNKAQRELAEEAMRQAAEELGWQNAEVTSAIWGAQQIQEGLSEEEINDYATVLQQHADAVRRFVSYFGTEARASGRSYEILGHPPVGEGEDRLREGDYQGGHRATAEDQLEAVAAVDSVRTPLYIPDVVGAGRSLRAADNPEWGYLGSVIAADFARDWRVNWVGKHVFTLEDLGALAQVARSTALEQAHILLVKNGRIVHSIQSGSGMPGETAPLPLGVRPEDVRALMEKYGADGWYFVHNHPAGDPRPSLGDFLGTLFIADKVPGFEGHVIVNHGQYDVITPEQIGQIGAARDQSPEALRDAYDEISALSKPKWVTTPLPPDPLLREGLDPVEYWYSSKFRVTSPESFIRGFAANLVNLAEQRPGWPIITLLDRKHRIRGILWLHPSIFWRPQEFRAWLTARKNEMGADWVYAAVPGSTYKTASSTSFHPVLHNYILKGDIDEAIDPMQLEGPQSATRSSNDGRAGNVKFQERDDDDINEGGPPPPGGAGRPPWGNGPGPGEEGWGRRTAYSEWYIRTYPNDWGPRKLWHMMIAGIARFLRGLKSLLPWNRSMRDAAGPGGEPFLPGIWARIKAWFAPERAAYERRGRVGDIPPEGELPGGARPTIRPIPPRPGPAAARRVAEGLVEGATTPTGSGKPPDIPINLNRIKNENDLREVMAQIMALLPDQFARARGERRGWAEERRMALEDGWTIEDFNRVMRTEGTVNAKRIIAGRLLRQEAGVEFSQKLQVWRDLQREFLRAADDPVRRAELEASLLEAQREMNASLQQFVGIMYGTVAAGSEAGRALAIHRMFVESLTPEERFLRRMLRGRTPRDEDLSALAEALQRRDMKKVNTIYRRIHKPGLLRQTIEYFINSILSGPATLGANVMGNWMHEVILRTPERGISAGIERAGLRQWLERVFRGEATPTERVPGEMMEAMRAQAKYKFGMISALKEAWHATWSERHGFTVKGEYRPPAIPGLMGKIIRTPSRWMEALDIGARYSARAGERAAQVWRKAYLEGIERGWTEQQIRTRAREIGAELDRWIEMDEMRRVDPRDPEVDYTYLTRFREYGKIKNAMDRAADISVFRDEVTMFSKYVKLLRSRYPWLTFIVPFINTPERILVQAVRRTPVGLAKTIQNIRTGKIKGGEASDRLAQGILGSMVTAGIYMLAKDGYITGGGPADPRERRNWLATGKQPYAFKVGNTWVSMARIEPLATTLGFAADLAEAQDDKIAGDAFDKLHYSIVNNITNKTYLEGMVSAAEAVGDPDRYGARLWKRMIGAAVPNLFARAAIAIDPVVRQRETMGETLLQRVPWFSERVPARLTGTGEPIVRGEDPFSRFASPFRYSEEAGPERNLERLFLESGYNPGAPPRYMRIPGTMGRRVNLTFPERQLYASYAQRATEFARTLAKDGDWSGLDVYAKQEVLRRIYRYAHDAARKAVYGSVLQRIQRGDYEMKEPA